MAFVLAATLLAGQLISVKVPSVAVMPA